LDHTIGVLHTLLKFKEFKVEVFSPDSIVWLLPAGKHRIKINTKFEGPSCGLFCLNGRALCKTKGLKWNLDHSLGLEFGDLVSTSNLLDSTAKDEFHYVEIENDLPILWTMEVNY
jgi:thiamine pyrophosphokinase